MKTRYGIHTIELTKTISRKWYEKVYAALASTKRNGAFFPDKKYESITGIKRYICNCFSDQGVIIRLYKQAKGKNKTKRVVPCFIEFRVNPLTLIQGYYTPKGVFQAKKKQLTALEACEIT